MSLLCVLCPFLFVFIFNSVHGARGGLDASFGMNNDLCGFEDTLDREHSLVDTVLKGCRDVILHERSPSLAY